MRLWKMKWIRAGFRSKSHNDRLDTRFMHNLYYLFIFPFKEWSTIELSLLGTSIAYILNVLCLGNFVIPFSIFLFAGIY